MGWGEPHKPREKMGATPPPPPPATSHETVVFAWSVPMADAIAHVLDVACGTPMLSAEVRLLLRQAQRDLERGVENCRQAHKRSVVSAHPHLAPVPNWPRRGAE